jgi:hypothetical protein
LRSWVKLKDAMDANEALDLKMAIAEKSEK